MLFIIKIRKNAIKDILRMVFQFYELQDRLRYLEDYKTAIFDIELFPLTVLTVYLKVRCISFMVNLLPQKQYFLQNKLLSTFLVG